MMALRTKLYLVAAIPAALSAVTFYLSATAHGSDATFFYRVGLTVAIAGFVFCLVTWNMHRVVELEEDIAFAEARITAADDRADEAQLRIDDLEKRLGRVEDDLECRTLAKKFWTGDSETELRGLLHPEEN